MQNFYEKKEVKKYVSKQAIPIMTYIILMSLLERYV